MPTIVQFRRGTEAQSDAFTGNVGELSVDTTNATVRVHDGSTAGGSRLATHADVTDRIQVANAAATFVTKSTALASNNAVKLLIDDRIQVANATTLFVNVSGDTMSGALAMGTYKITGMGDPISDQDAATKTYVDTAVANIVDSAPAALDTLNELAAALGDDASFSTTVTNSIGAKLNSSAVSAFGLTLVDDADAATARTTLGLGTAATIDVGTTASKIVQLDGSARLPAVDGSQLTGISAGATVTDKTDDVNYNIVFTSETSGTQSLAGIDNTAFTFNPSTGTCNATVFNATSDKKLKKNIQTIGESLSKVSQLRGVNFNWKKNSIKSMGVIAQEVEVVVPEVVSTDEGDQKSVNYGALVGLLIEAVKDLKNEVDELKANK
jgi:hypothetical protein